MAKIGRNERCPCGSGKKYKHCCARNPRPPQRPASQAEQLKVSLMDAVERVGRAAAQNKQSISELGVFVLFSTTKGNGWLFEITQSDCVQLARDGEILAAPINENPETIEVEWSHTFRLVDKQMVLTAYQDRRKEVLEDCPVKEVSASIRRIAKKISPELLDKIHLDAKPADSAEPAE